ncbi:LacI family DNA-binding transcriptional regulator [Curtobacterium sp. RRHDQ10]|uniref:LacI family DNA-binding transcriptional regulator n=1 Tax=Curtobacterium phyllosphaerae TaxID=3413379 RepID=UPI003BEFEBA5
MTQSMSTPPRKATRRDVARRAGVSDAVVSYTLNGGAPVAAATAQRVRDAVEELGYSPNQAARALRSGSARTLVLVVPDGSDPIFANPFFSEYASVIEGAARERGYALYTTASSMLPDVVIGRFREFAARQVDGVLVLQGDAQLDRAALDRVGLPWIELNAVVPTNGGQSLSADLREGAFVATTHLLEHGHRRVGFIGELDPVEPRYIGWLEACAAAGVAAGPHVQTAITRPGGHDAGDRIAADPDRAPAYFVASDRTAVGVLRSLHEHDVDVPDDVALVAFDGSWEGEYAWPGLTSFRQPIERMAESAVERVLAGKLRAAGHELFEGALVVRQSCGCHRAER